MIGKNNVLNIRSSASFKWLGQEGQTNGFCNFTSVMFCWRCGAYLIMRSYRRAKVRSIEAIIKRWAPPSENNTEAYIDFVCEQTGFSRKYVPRSETDVALLLVAMMFMELGIPKKDRVEAWRVLPTSVATIIVKSDIKFYKK